MDVMDRSSSDYTPAQEAWPSNPKTSTDGPLLPSREGSKPDQEAWPSNPKISTDGPLLPAAFPHETFDKNSTEFSTCKQFTDVIRAWLTSQGIVYDRPDPRGWTDERGWTLPVDYPGHIKITIWDYPMFFHQSGGSPVELADEIHATIVAINRIWPAAKEAFPNMDLKIEEYNESGGKIVYIQFPINKEALRRFEEDEEDEEDDGE